MLAAIMASSAYDQQHESKSQSQKETPKSQQSEQMQTEADKERARLCAAQKAFGTNSPPLEATGSARPMGMASVEGDIEAGYVPDSEQRRAYFGTTGVEETKEDKMGREKAEVERGRQMKKVGQSMAAQVDERN